MNANPSVQAVTTTSTGSGGRGRGVLELDSTVLASQYFNFVRCIDGEHFYGNDEGFGNNLHRPHI